MNIEWITVSAQLINFLVLVWLLNRFLFRPVLAVMASREALIDEQLQQASVQTQEADKVRQEYQRAISELESEKSNILEETGKQAEETEKRLLDQARQEVSERRNTWLESLEAEKHELDDAFRKSIAATTRSICDSLLRRITNSDLNKQMLSSFVGQLDLLDAKTRNRLSGASDTICVVSAEPLDSGARQSLTQELRERLQNNTDVVFQVDEQLIAGLRLKVGGFELDWHLNDMLDTLDQELSHAAAEAYASAH